MIYTLEQIREAVAPIAKKYQIPAIYLFGSYARGTATENSDLDFLIEMPGVKLVGFEWGGLYNDFDEAFETSIDLVTMRALLQKPRMPSEKRFKETVMRERKLIYVLDCNSDTTYQKGQEEGAEESGSG